MNKKIQRIIAGIIITVSFFTIFTNIASAARTSNIWHERFSSYVELIWYEGRDILIRGTNKHLNWGSTSGTSGYGLRDNAGSMEYKDSGGSWAGFSAGSQTPWTANIDGGGYNLTNVDYITATGTNATSSFTAINVGTTTSAYAVNVQGAIQTDTAFYGDYWISASGNSMAIQPTGDTDDFFSFKTPSDRPTIKREGGKYIYIESSNVNDVGISFRKDADHSGTINYYKDTEEFGLTSKDPLVFKVCGDYDDYVKICSANNIPELSVASSSGFKINAGGTNALLLNHDGGNVGINTTSTAYKLDVNGTLRVIATSTLATTTITDLTVSGTSHLAIITGTTATFTSFVGALTGNADTATALASNGANCNAGLYPLGVDASGAVESCTDATTEINTVVNALGGTNLTCASETCNVDDSFLANDGDTGTGAYNFSDATLQLPNASNPTVDASGETAINTTAASSSIRYYDGTAERAIYPWGFGGLSYASSTLSYIGAYGAAGTTTILLFNAPTGLTLTGMYCKTDTGTTTVHFEDGTNDTDSLVCGPDGIEDDGSIANNTWTLWEDFKISIGTQTGDPNVITITPIIRKDAN